MDLNKRRDTMLRFLKNANINQLPDGIDDYLSRFDENSFCVLLVDLQNKGVKGMDEIMLTLNEFLNKNNSPVKPAVLSSTENVVQKPNATFIIHPQDNAAMNEVCADNSTVKPFTQVHQPIQVQSAQQAPAAAAANPVAEKAEPVIAQPVVPLSNEAVTGHTASLWKYNPIPEKEPEPHSEYDVRTIKLPSGTLMGARARGKKHKHEGTNCDDWFEIGSIEDWVLIALSDGAGSKKYSRIGARESCKAAMEYMKDKFAGIKSDAADIINDIALPFSDANFVKSCGTLASVVQNSVLAAFAAVEKAYEDRKADEAYTKTLNRELAFKDLSGTLLVAAAIPALVDGRKEYLIISCQIGDGMIASVDANAPFEKALRLLGQPDGGSFAGETDFLTSEQMNQIETLMKRTKIGRSPLSCLMVMSDGVADDYYPNDPQMLRLYLDLQLNGILGDADEHKVTVSNKNLELIKKVPKPLAYPWVNDPSVQVSIQYANRLMTSTELSLEELWKNKDIINVGSLSTSGTPLSQDGQRDETLKLWLDNYVERGSFDDRTLVVFYL